GPPRRPARPEPPPPAPRAGTPARPGRARGIASDRARRSPAPLVVRRRGRAGPPRPQHLHPLRPLPHRLPDLPRAQDRARLASGAALSHARSRRGTDRAERPAAPPSRPVPGLPRLRDRVPRGSPLQPDPGIRARAAQPPRGPANAGATARRVGVAIAPPSPQPLARRRRPP